MLQLAICKRGVRSSSCLHASDGSESVLQVAAGRPKQNLKSNNQLINAHMALLVHSVFVCTRKQYCNLYSDLPALETRVAVISDVQTGVQDPVVL